MKPKSFHLLMEKLEEERINNYKKKVAMLFLSLGVYIEYHGSVDNFSDLKYPKTQHVLIIPSHSATELSTSRTLWIGSSRSIAMWILNSTASRCIYVIPLSVTFFNKLGMPSGFTFKLFIVKLHHSKAFHLLRKS